MNLALTYGLSCLMAYCFGAVPFGLLVARTRGVDIRTVGSGNIGATNVLRNVGKVWGILTLVLDVLKGLAGSVLFPLVAERILQQDGGLVLRTLSGICAIAGHNWPIYLGFKGGKGVATSAGVLLGLARASLGVGFGTWILAVTITRYVSIASMLAALAIGGSAWWFYRDDVTRLRPIALTILAILVIWRHRTNIQRLMNGTESRFSRKKKEDETGRGTRDS